MESQGEPGESQGENQGRARGKDRGRARGEPSKCWGIDRGQRGRAGGEMGEELWESLFPLVM